MNKSHRKKQKSLLTRTDLKTTLVGVIGFVLVNVGEKLASGEFSPGTLAITALIAIGLYFAKDKEPQCKEEEGGRNI